MSLSPLDWQEYEQYVARLGVKQEQEPIRAWKLGYVSEQDGGSLCFSAVSQPVRYKVVDVFQCICTQQMSSIFSSPGFRTDPLPPHPLPGKLTGCGFYAMKQRSAVRTGGVLPLDADKCQDLWLLEADLYGRVVKCRYGYRAQKQRVLSIRPYFKPEDYVNGSELELADYQAATSRFGLNDLWTVPSLARITPTTSYYRLGAAVQAGYLLRWPSPASLSPRYMPPGLRGMTRGVITYGIPAYSETALEHAQIVAPGVLAGMLGGVEVHPYEGDGRSLD